VTTTTDALFSPAGEATIVQVVGYDPSPDPALLISDGDGVERQALTPGTELELTLDGRSCAGRIVTDDDHPRHVPCPDGAASAPRCVRCTEIWVCARCTGTCLKDEMDCHEPHVVYLAAFAPDVFKVGVTREWRLEQRLREQGADRGAHLRTVADGRIAREIEADIAEEIPDRIRIGPKLSGLHQTVDESAWAERLADFDPIDRVDFDYGLDLDDRPIPATIATGTVHGVQGRLLVLERGATPYAVDLRDLVGHELTAGASDRSRQASLETY
jgi:hypothetical protein